MEDLIFDQKAYSEYMDDFNYSQGFYVTPAEDGSVLLGGIRRVEECSDERYRKAERAAKFAVAEHNKKMGEEGFLQFGKILNLNVEPTAGAIYYITMSVDAGGELRRYQLKIWEKLNSGYQVQIFRPAPYCLKSSDQLSHKSKCIAILDLMPWMDENYLYYKCFSRLSEVIGVEVMERIKGEGDPSCCNQAYLWLRDFESIKEIVNKYKGRKMPLSNVFYTFDLSIKSFDIQRLLS